MTKENQRAKQEKNLALQSQENAIELVTFFFTYTGKEIQENAQKFQFWQKELFGSEDLNDLEFRKEILRIGELLDALNVLASKFTQAQIKQTLHDMARMQKLTKRVLREEFGEEANHV